MKAVRDLALLALVLGVSAETLSHQQIRAVVARDSAGVTLLSTAIGGCKTRVDACSLALNSLTAGGDVTPVVSAIGDLVATVRAAVSTCKAAGSITTTDLVGLQTDISGLSQSCGTLSTAFAAKKDVVAGLNGCGFVADAVLDMQTQAGALFEAIVGLTTDLHLTGDISGLFGSGVSASSLSSDSSVQAILTVVNDLASHLNLGASTYGNGACVNADPSGTVMGGTAYTATAAISGGATATAVITGSGSSPVDAKGASPTGASSGTNSGEPDFCTTSLATKATVVFTATGSHAPYPTTAIGNGATYTTANGTEAKGATPVQAGSSTVTAITAMIGVVGFTIAMLL